MTGTHLDRTAVARMVDHTLLKPEATSEDVVALVAEAQRLGVYAICVSPSMLPVDAGEVRVATVCGFPSGKHHSEVKAAEAARAVADGADEVDMVIDIGAAVAGRWQAVEADIAAVRAAVPAPVLLKVIIESAALSDAQVIGACRAAEAAGADFVKTSTGFHPGGGATVHAVELMAATVGGRLGVKASGTAAVPESPSRVAPAAIRARAAAPVRMPPDALTPSRPPTVAAISSTACTVAPPPGWNPVEVFTKSAPAASAARQAPITCASLSAADSMITLSSTVAGTAARTAAMSASTACHRPATAAPMSITMSTSSAPSAGGGRPSRRTSPWCLPDGK